MNCASGIDRSWDREFFDRHQHLLPVSQGKPIRLESFHTILGGVRVVMADAGTPMPDMDGLIAATAMSHNLTLVTNNIADFQSVPYLRLQDWTKD